MIIVDRILNGLAVCIKDGISVDIPLSAISGNVREGDALLADESQTQYSVDNIETQKRRTNITERFNRIKKRNE